MSDDYTIAELERALAELSGMNGTAAAAVAAQMTDDDDTDPSEHAHSQSYVNPLNNIISALANASDRAAVDALAAQYCYINSKGNRRRVVALLFALPMTSSARHSIHRALHRHTSSIRSGHCIGHDGRADDALLLTLAERVRPLHDGSQAQEHPINM